MDPCVEWQEGRTHGYGRVNVDGARLRAHRWIWSLINGEIPPGMVIRHLCDNPICVHPDHLLLGTQADNMRDMHERGRFVGCTGRRVPACKQGHEFTEENTYVSPRTGARGCRTCARVNQQARRDRRRAGAR
jgi:hypothetical protein